MCILVKCDWWQWMVGESSSWSAEDIRDARFAAPLWHNLPTVKCNAKDQYAFEVLTRRRYSWKSVTVCKKEESQKKRRTGFKLATFLSHNLISFAALLSMQSNPANTYQWTIGVLHFRMESLDLFFAWILDVINQLKSWPCPLSGPKKTSCLLGGVYPFMPLFHS